MKTTTLKYPNIVTLIAYVFGGYANAEEMFKEDATTEDELLKGMVHPRGGSLKILEKGAMLILACTTFKAREGVPFIEDSPELQKLVAKSPEARYTMKFLESND
jgi:hypothetical protein